jgi:DNA-binding transcriptional MocR family regulator
LSRGANRLLKLLCWYKARFGEVYPLQATLARNLKVSLRTVSTWRAELVAGGAIQVKHGGPHSSEYVIVEAFQKQALSGESCVPSAQHLRSICVASASGPYMSLSSLVEVKSSGPVEIELPPATIPNEYGRQIPNPTWLHLRDVLRAAEKRIRRAEDPEAYEDAIIRAELAKIERKPPQHANSLKAHQLAKVHNL